MVLDSQAGAAGAGFGIYLVLALLTQSAAAVKYSPAGLMTLGDQLLSGDPASAVWPVTTALTIALVAALAAAASFRVQEI